MCGLMTDQGIPANEFKVLFYLCYKTLGYRRFGDFNTMVGFADFLSKP